MNAKLPNTDPNWVDPDDAPELTGAELNNPDAMWRVDGKVVDSATGKAAFRAMLAKQRISIALDPDVLAWFKEQSGGRGYQTLINETLRGAMREKGLEDTLRKVIREELQLK